MKLIKFIKLIALIFLFTNASASERTLINFDDLKPEEVVFDQYISKGILFGRQHLRPAIFAYYRSSVSSPNALVSEIEGKNDLNPSFEHGNNQASKPIEFSFCSSSSCNDKLITNFISFNVLWLNKGNVVVAKAYDEKGGIVDTKQYQSSLSVIAIELQGKIHRVVVTFIHPEENTIGSFEDLAAIDDIQYSPVQPNTQLGNL